MPPGRDLRRPRRRGADQLQRGTAAGDPGGLRVGRAGRGHRRGRLPRDDRGARRGGPAHRAERVRHPRRGAARRPPPPSSSWRATSSCAGAWAPPGTSASPPTISAGTCWRATGRCTRRSIEAPAADAAGGPDGGHRLEAAADDRPRLPGRDDRRLPDRRGGDVGAVVADDRRPHQLAPGVAARDGRLRERRTLPDRRLRGDGRAVGADSRRGLPLHRGSALRSSPRSDRRAAAARGGADASPASR